MFNMNDPFWPYAKHTQLVEDIIDCILKTSESGTVDNLSINVDEDLSQSDLDYIKSEVMRRR